MITLEIAFISLIIIAFLAYQTGRWVGSKAGHEKGRLAGKQEVLDMYYKRVEDCCTATEILGRELESLQKQMTKGNK